ncbi:MAG: hypothetical protein AAGF85_03925 [Bacteroidota bacterium]
MARDLKHPVWNVYDVLRTVRLNVLYNQIKLSKVVNWNTFFEISIAITAPSSALASIHIFQGVIGQELWRFLVAITAVLAVVKPFLGFINKIKAKEALISSYEIAFHELEKLRIEIHNTQKYDNGHMLKLEEVRTTLHDVQKKYPSTGKGDKKLASMLKAQVETEFPSASFYLPPR